MKFWKYHVNGNDFILLHHRCQLSKDMIVKMCDRHTGIGADGVLFVYHQHGLLFYEHYNSDGSEAKMCGNGIRCVGYDEMVKQHQNHCEVKIHHAVYEVRMSGTNFVTVRCPLPKILGRNTYDSGVKHVIRKKYRASHDANVDVVEYLDPMNFSLSTKEIGVGFTKSCGTGNVAAYYHGYRKGLLHRIAIGHNPGGMNLLRYGNHSIYMSAMVSKVFCGSIDWNFLKL